MPVLARTVTPALKPSDIFCVRELATTVVSAESLLINSPVLFLSKNAVSCLMIDEKALPLNLFTNL